LFRHAQDALPICSEYEEIEEIVRRQLFQEDDWGRIGVHG
jgi:hypothetical protein